ncbi:hypothetical protein TUM4445_07000 [Shewanella sp. MBTL60-112-B2]|nr:hypothetical protein TUM4444_21350 [Shewanella sp. MBTL60-112-B1]GIU27156.1 hypothetical protein TUM4445_07000 [Shewanella sp. MBTL60-112-B2]
MARLLVQQTAYGAAPALQLENDEQLQWLAQALVLDPKVMSASIFSEDGVRLSFAQSVIDEELEPDSEELTNILDQYPPYVEAVSQDGNNLGYVEVRLEPKYFFNEIKEAHHINMEQQQMMLLIAGLIGMLLSRALSFKRADFDRRKARVKLRQLLAKKNEKAAAKTAKKQAAEELKQAKLKQAKKDKTNPASNVELEAVKTTDNDAISTKAEASGLEQTSSLSKANRNAAAEEKTGNQSPSVLAATVNESEQTLDSSNRANTELTEPAPEKPTVKPRAKAKPRTKAKPKSSDETKPAASVKPKAPTKPKVKAKPKADPKDEA